MIIMVLVCGLDRLKKVLKYVFKVHRSQIFFFMKYTTVNSKKKKTSIFRVQVPVLY